MMEKFEDSVNKICAQIAIVGLVAFITSYLQVRKFVEFETKTRILYMISKLCLLTYCLLLDNLFVGTLLLAFVCYYLFASECNLLSFKYQTLHLWIVFWRKPLNLW